MKNREGLQLDLRATRRQALKWLGGSGLAAFLTSCVGGNDVGLLPDDASTGGGSSSTGCDEIPEETAGPYPGDGSNGPNVLTTTGVVRSDITTSFGGLSGTAAGVPLTIQLKIVDINNTCGSLAGYAVYLWHCDREGRYSLYSSGVTNQNYLRGVQITDVDGYVTFTSIFPACYDGRWPHIHFEVYPSVDATSNANGKIATSQLALPVAICNEVYATPEYSASVSNLAKVSLASDNVFSDDGGVLQLPAMTGDISSGYVAELTVGVPG